MSINSILPINKAGTSSQEITLENIESALSDLKLPQRVKEVLAKLPEALFHPSLKWKTSLANIAGEHYSASYSGADISVSKDGPAFLSNSGTKSPYSLTVFANISGLDIDLMRSRFLSSEEKDRFQNLAKSLFEHAKTKGVKAS